MEATYEVLVEDSFSNNGNSLFFDDNWYKLPQNKNKILGEPKQVSGRFGDVITYVGTIEDLKKIDVDLNFPTDFHNTQAIGSSVINEVNEVAAQFEPTKKRNIQRAIQKSNERVPSEGDLPENAEVQDFFSVAAEYNEGITPDEIEVYVWYKSKIGHPLSHKWGKLIGATDIDSREPFIYQVDQEKINNWFKRGLIFYFNGSFVPAYLYLSGDIYNKRATLTRERDEIIDSFGQEYFDGQEKALQQVFTNKDQARLKITPEAGGLVILPISKFAKTFMIENIQSNDKEEFQIKKVTAAANKNYGKPDFLNDYKVRSYNRHSFSKLSLLDAFQYWMIKNHPALEEKITVEDIINYYLNQKNISTKTNEFSSDEVRAKEKAKAEKLRSAAQIEGNRLFKFFLNDQLLPNDKIRLEIEWNGTFNNYVPVDFNKIPIALTLCKSYKGKPEKIRPEKRESVAFIMSEGVGCLAYGVGVGKTLSAILTMSAFLDAGYCKRPFLCVPNQVYKQFISEIKAFAPHIPINEGYNLSEEYVENFIDADGNIEKVPEGSITVFTYEGLERIGFSDSTAEQLIKKLYNILSQGDEDLSSKKGDKKVTAFYDRLNTLIGKGLKGGMYNIEDFGFDFACYDEAHAMKKVFTTIKGEAEDEGQKGKNPYKIQAGSPSSRALKGFMLNHYILSKNHNRNIMLLTATPFTNSPLEIFSMLSMIAYNELENIGLDNLKAFFDTFVKVSTELVIDAKLRPVYRQVILGFNNLTAMQSIIFRFINYKTGEDVGVNRPDKYVLPYKKKIENGLVINLSPEEMVSTTLEMTPPQKEMMDEVISYVEYGSSLGTVAHTEETPESDEDTEAIDESQDEAIDEDGLGEAEKLSVRTLKGLNYSRNLALSPYLYEFSNLGTPTYRQYIESSPKLKYVVECIRSVRNYHLDHDEPISGQVIYMDRGVKYFDLIKEYLIKEVGYKEHEIGIIKSGLPKAGKRSKEYIKNLFNGETYNENTKEFDLIDDSKRIKVVIGSSTIKEGINLQKYGTVLYNCFLDWNPTDVEQLTGRIWRQGNLYKAVRVVNPLMMDSADIFIFQKLQEKTSRLNDIWSRSGEKTELNLDEFDPEELKFALIRDPNVIAHLMSIDEKKELEGTLFSLSRNLETVDSYKYSFDIVNSRFEDALRFAEQYRDVNLGESKLQDAKVLVDTINSIVASQKTKDGKKIVDRIGWDNLTDKERESGSYVRQNRIQKEYWFGSFAVAVRDLIKSNFSIFSQYGVNIDLNNPDSLKSIIDRINDEIISIREKKELIESPEHLQELAMQVVQKREEEKEEFKTFDQTIIDFSKLNYLLRENSVQIRALSKIQVSCPPMKDGVRLIDSKSLKQLDECIEKQPQTKSLYYVDGQGYSPERKALHDKIIEDLFKGVKCVSQKSKPICVLTGGAPGSGKSTWLKNNASFLMKDSVFHLDADEIRSKLKPEYQGWNAAATHEETKDVVNDILNHIADVSCRYDFIYDGTMNTAKKYFTLINKIKSLGYEIFIVFMVIPEAESKKRALARYQHTGRYVPMSVIDEFYEKLPPPIDMTKGRYSLDQLKPKVDGYVVVDSISGKIIERGGISLPENRVYRGNLKLDFDGHEPAEKEKAPEPKIEIKEAKLDAKQAIKTELETLKIAVEFLTENERKDAEKLIETLELSLKFL